MNYKIMGNSAGVGYGLGLTVSSPIAPRTHSQNDITLLTLSPSQIDELTSGSWSAIGQYWSSQFTQRVFAAQN